ncbi:MAG: SDR family NAD(P)-dependent oxidoreductase [Steroidobacteraceae bacterium]
MYRPFDLSGSVSVVVGGNTGIGFGMAQALAAAGAHVVIGGRNAENNANAVGQLEAAGGSADCLECDVMHEESVRSFMAEVVARHGRMDACFMNAGGGTRAPPFVDMSTDEWMHSIQWNLHSAYFCYREAAKHMIQLGHGGSIVGTASVAAIRSSGSTHYAAAKAGMVAMARSLAPQLGQHGIRVNTILPGFVETRISRAAAANEKFHAALVKRIPCGRIGQPSDFGGVAVYLASSASAWQTADTFVIDGGMTCL